MTVHPDQAGIRGDELRALVREVVRDLLPMLRDAAGKTGHQAEPVAIASDDDLNAFALRVLDLARDPARAAALRDGRLRFRLSAPDTPPAAGDAQAIPAALIPGGGARAVPAAPTAGGDARVVPAALTAGGDARAVPQRETAVRRHEKGAVTERHVAEAARAGARLVLGRRAVLTPLAKERVRASGLVVTRED
ncbi:hypothetical protein AB0O34_23020 [Sphaerisporangium sp. NPDC088356]|uniref:hypothetical protein n=1 Tax=Sphaerisporangium sp. NPDC088356 TaxID=3154871 RepID=UPI00341BFB6B